MDALLDTCGPRSVTWLLLLQLCVVKAAADCPKPQGGVNIVLTNNALLMNAFPEGVDVTLECANGYVVESGTGSMSCVDNKWTEPDLTCKKKDCGPPRAQPHMSFNISAGTLFGALVKVVCDEGFQVAGSSYKQCYAFGWSGRAKCGFVTCDKPADVTNGRSSWEFQAKPTYGEIIRYVCNHGYALVGKHSVVCSATGEYDSPPPTCEDKFNSFLIITETAAPRRSTPPAQESSTSTEPSASPSAPRAAGVTTSATPTVSSSVRGSSAFSTAEGKAATTSETPMMSSSSLPGNLFGTIDTSKDIGYTPVIVSVICVTLVVCFVALFLHKFLLKRKGSANGTAPIY
ncbi:complement decay-accelerating factor isoform X2 [Pseudoliparis swirei]|uniref:complement decay-accelerating factor isoform X2 n=1 Tax=Pseudoliparis swirei TaxID=2059687 RepID=UPI0024BD84EC|nr:complement decay-accelerating factor isoform X2 [Pseudoliparis swirei]